MKKLIADFLFNRRIQVHIVTVFFLVFFAALSITTRYTYSNYSSTINNLSFRTVYRLNKLFSEKMLSAKDRIELTLQLLQNVPSIQASDEILSSEPVVRNAMLRNPVLSGIEIVYGNGNRLSIVAKGSNGDPGYEETILQRSDSGAEELSIYRDGKGSIVSQSRRSVPFPSGSSTSGGATTVEWREKECFGAKQVCATASVLDENGGFIGEIIAGFDQNRFVLSATDAEIATKGEVFVFDVSKKSDPSVIWGDPKNGERYATLISHGYEKFLATKQSGFLLEGEGGVPYLMSIIPGWEFAEHTWFDVVVIPYKDLFFSVVRTENKTRLFALSILILCAVVTYYSSRYVASPIVSLAGQVDRIRDFDFADPAPLGSRIREILDLEDSIRRMRTAIRSFAKYVPYDLVRTLIRRGEEVKLGGERKRLTVFFSDVRGFTTLCESMSPEEITPLLSEYFDDLSKIILSHEGTIDKYIGDSIMAFWGAPEAVIQPEEKACLACLQCMATLRKKQEWVTGFGIHSGDAVVGNIGTSERINYTAFGDTVNTASRLQSINKEYGTLAIIGESVRSVISEVFITRPLDCVAVKGKTAKIKIFELVGMKEGDFAVSSDRMKLVSQFSEGYRLEEEGRYSEALRIFTDLATVFPEDIPTRKRIVGLQARIGSEPM